MSIMFALGLVSPYSRPIHPDKWRSQALQNPQNWLTICCLCLLGSCLEELVGMFWDRKRTCTPSAKGVLLAQFISGYVARRFSTLCLGFVLLILHTQWAKQHPRLKFTHGVWRHCGTALSNSHLRSGIVFQAISYLDGGCKVESRFKRHRMAHRMAFPSHTHPRTNQDIELPQHTYQPSIKINHLQ